MKIPKGFWTPCYKLVMYFGDNKMFSWNANRDVVCDGFPSIKLPLSVLKYKLNRITVPTIGKLFGLSTPEPNDNSGEVALLFGIGLNVIPAPERIGDYTDDDPDETFRDFWRAYTNDNLTSEYTVLNMFDNAVLMDAFLPQEFIWKG